MSLNIKNKVDRQEELNRFHKENGIIHKGDFIGKGEIMNMNITEEEFDSWFANEGLVKLEFQVVGRL